MTEITAEDFGLPEQEFNNDYSYYMDHIQEFWSENNLVIKDIDWHWQPSSSSDYITIEPIEINTPVEINTYPSDGTSGTYTIESINYVPRLQVDRIYWPDDDSYTIHYDDGSILYIPTDVNNGTNNGQ